MSKDKVPKRNKDKGAKTPVAKKLKKKVKSKKGGKKKKLTAGVPKRHLKEVYEGEWADTVPGVGSDKIKNTPEHRLLFRSMLEDQYHDKDLLMIGADLETLRKASYLEPICGRKGPSVGHAMKALLNEEMQAVMTLAGEISGDARISLPDFAKATSKVTMGVDYDEFAGNLSGIATGVLSLFKTK
jgi:hypothetical protein